MHRPNKLKLRWGLLAPPLCFGNDERIQKGDAIRRPSPIFEVDNLELPVGSYFD